jgi:hypothetical protein
MLDRLVRKEGVPALAYSVDDVSPPRPYLLKILHSDTQFVLSLERSVLIDESDHLFTLRYEGDNLVPGKASLRHVDIALSDDTLQLIARQGKPGCRTLSLTLRAPCPVWYPKSLSKSNITGFYELSTLAKATQVLIVFDTRWLGKGNLARLQSVVEGSGELGGIPVLPQFARCYQQADWSIFNSAHDAKPKTSLPKGDVTSEVVPSIEEDDAPPSYESVPSKRQRDCRSSN